MTKDEEQARAATMVWRGQLLTLRIVVLDPPAGVRWALQIGKDALELPSAKARGKVTFTTQVRGGTTGR